jgi:hypothetical protein
MGAAINAAIPAPAPLATLFKPLLNPAHPSFGFRVLNNDSNIAFPYSQWIHHNKKKEIKQTKHKKSKII